MSTTRATAQAALMAGAACPSPEAVAALLAAGADPNTATTKSSPFMLVGEFGGGGVTALQEGARRGSAKVVQQLLRAGAEVDAADYAGRTALMKSAGNGKVAALRALLSAGTSLNAVQRDGWTALLCAAWRPSAECVAALVSAGADPNIANREGHAPLMLSAQKGSLPSIRALLAAGAKVDVLAADGLSALTAAVVGAADEVCIAALLAAGADPNQQAIVGPLKRRHLSPLHAAAHAGKAAAVRQLLAAGGCIGSTCHNGFTVLQCAIKSGDVATMQAALAAGAAVDVVDGAGDMALSCAARYGDVAAIHALFDAGADTLAAGQGVKAVEGAFGVGKGPDAAVARGLLEPAQGVAVALLLLARGDAGLRGRALARAAEVGGVAGAVMRFCLAPKACAVCGKESGGVSKCARCVCVWYCGAECQRANWPAHRGTCKELVAVMAEERKKQAGGRKVDEAHG